MAARLRGAWQPLPCEPVPDTVPHPFIRTVHYNIDNCTGTNKSQFMFGALALLALEGALDAICIEFMVVGHTKMELDKAFSKSGSAFRRSDVFNLGMLVELFEPYFTVHAYDGAFLKHYRDTTVGLFSEIKGILSWRSFYIVGDDGGLDADLVRMEGSEATYTSQSMKTATQKLAKRSLPTVLRAALTTEGYRGFFLPRGSRDTVGIE